MDWLSPLWLFDIVKAFKRTLGVGLFPHTGGVTMTTLTLNAKPAIVTEEDETARLLTAAEIVYSLDFVNKLVKKIHKDNPKFSAQQIADAVGKVYGEKMEAMAKRLVKIEEVRAKYQTLRSVEPVVADTLAILKKMGEVRLAPLPEVKVTATTTRKPASNGAAKPDANQQQLSL